MKWYIFLPIVFLIGCKTIEQTVEVEREVKVVERDTTIVIAPDSASVMALLECDSLNRVIMAKMDVRQGERIQPHITFEGFETQALLRMDCHEDSLKKVIECKDSIISTTKSAIETQYIRRRNGYDRFVSWGFWILLLILLSEIAIWVLKTKYRILK